MLACSQVFAYFGAVSEKVPKDSLETLSLMQHCSQQDCWLDQLLHNDQCHHWHTPNELYSFVQWPPQSQGPSHVSDLLKLAAYHHPDNNVILLETLALVHHELKNLTLDLFKLTIEFYICNCALVSNLCPSCLCSGMSEPEARNTLSRDDSLTLQGPNHFVPSQTPTMSPTNSSKVATYNMVPDASILSPPMLTLMSI